jgi:diaminopimelate epimerase
MTQAKAQLHFAKYQAIGNDYLVVEEDQWAGILSPSRIRYVCDRHLGVGSDGILVRVSPTTSAPFEMRILNPDGTEAEKSGNGLRIFARYLWDRNLVGEAPFDVHTRGGRVTCRILEQGAAVSVDMGRASFDNRDIPVAGAHREVLLESMQLGNEMIKYSCVTIGNPHCVIFRPEISAALAKSLGPLIETDVRFGNRTNVQFAHVLDRTHVRVEVWERGAGYTRASGSSGCAVAAVGRRLGLVDADVTIQMAGGSLAITVSPEFDLRMTGPVSKVMDGALESSSFFDAA